LLGFFGLPSVPVFVPGVFPKVPVFVLGFPKVPILVEFVVGCSVVGFVILGFSVFEGI
jgi:hypothetical protein